MLTLIVFHPIQFISLHLFGHEAHKKSADLMSYFLVQGLRVLGTRITFEGVDNLPCDRPLIIISNHQSLFDIPPVVLAFRKHHPKFISKIELGKGIPSVSYNLKHSGAALIDRKNQKQSIREIFKLGKLIQEKNYAACIYPEGTRSRNGKVRRFKEAGVATLLRAAPSALIVPFVIDGNWKIQCYGKYPLGLGVKVKYTILDPIEPKGYKPEELVEHVQQVIKDSLHQG